MKIDDIKNELKNIAMEQKYICSINKEINNIINEIEEYTKKLKTADGIMRSAYAKRCKSLSSLLKQKELMIKSLEKNSNEKFKNVSNLEYPQKLILEYHYFYGMTYDEISDKLNYSIARVYQLHRKGLEELLQVKQNSCVLER